MGITYYVIDPAVLASWLRARERWYDAVEATQRLLDAAYLGSEEFYHSRPIFSDSWLVVFEFIDSVRQVGHKAHGTPFHWSMTRAQFTEEVVDMGKVVVDDGYQQFTVAEFLRDVATGESSSS